MIFKNSETVWNPKLAFGTASEVLEETLTSQVGAGPQTGLPSLTVKCARPPSLRCPLVVRSLSALQMLDQISGWPVGTPVVLEGVHCTAVHCCTALHWCTGALVHTLLAEVADHAVGSAAQEGAEVALLLRGEAEEDGGERDDEDPGVRPHGHWREHL